MEKMNELYYNPAKFYKAVSRLNVRLKRFKVEDIEKVRQGLSDVNLKLEPLKYIDEPAALTPDQEEKLASIRELLARVLEPLFQGYEKSSGDMDIVPPGTQYGIPAEELKSLPPDLDIYKCPEFVNPFWGLRRMEGERCHKCHKPLFKDPDFQ